MTWFRHVGLLQFHSGVWPDSTAPAVTRSLRHRAAYDDRTHMVIHELITGEVIVYESDNELEAFLASASSRSIRSTVLH